MKYIDVSQYQSLINTNVNADGVILRLGYTGYGSNKPAMDKMFEKFYEAYHKAGVPIGIYYFTIASDEAMVDMETSWVLNKIKNKQIDLPIWVDVESQDKSVAWTRLDKKTRTNLVARWCNNIQAAGYYVGIYANTDWFTRKLDDSVIKLYDKWVAQYANKCKYTGKYGMWQYSSKENALIHGVKSSTNCVDISYVYVDYKTVIARAGLNHLGTLKTTDDVDGLIGDDNIHDEVEVKSIEDVAREVINGLWGNGLVRKAKLIAAGYSYKEVQDMVNKILNGR